MGRFALDWLAVDAVTCELCSAAISLLTGNNTGNFACLDGSNYALLLGNPRPEPLSTHRAYFLCKIGAGNYQGTYQGIIRGVTGKEQGIVFGWAPAAPHHRGPI